MLQIVEQTHEEKVKIYMKCTKRKLIEMLIENNRIIKLRGPVADFTNAYKWSSQNVTPYSSGYNYRYE